MANVDCNTEMINFHRDEVTLSQNQQTEMRNRRDAGRKRLDSGLELKSHPQPDVVASQGSYQMRTMTQDDDNEYDIDDGVYFTQENLTDSASNSLTPLAARERVCDALKWDGRLKHDAVVKKNCVRQEYPEGYHIDMPVYRVVTTEGDDGEIVERYELASDSEWVESDARAVTRWFNNIVGELNAGESDGSQMRRVTKLTKKLARSRKDWKPKTTSGICMTKLVADHFVHVDGRDDDALRETWEAIKEAIDSSTELSHPVQKDVNLSEANDTKLTFFRDCLGFSLELLEGLDAADCTREQAHEIWDDVFNTTFFADQPNGDEDEKSEQSALTVTSIETARRNDGGGRFG